MYNVANTPKFNEQTSFSYEFRRSGGRNYVQAAGCSQ